MFINQEIKDPEFLRLKSDITKIRQIKDTLCLNNI